MSDNPLLDTFYKIKIPKGTIIELAGGQTVRLKTSLYLDLHQDDFEPGDHETLDSNFPKWHPSDDSINSVGDNSSEYN